MTDLIASLGMYDHPAQQSANNTLWTAIADALREQGVEDVPRHLDRTRDVRAIWHDPRLLLAQACGYPLVVDTTLALRVVALPVYDVPGCDGATHTSVLVMRANDGRQSLDAFRGGRAAINDLQSNTGMNLFRAALAPIAGPSSQGFGFFRDVVETGSHRASIVAVGGGQADIAAIDCVTYAAIERFEPDLAAQVRILQRSPASPTLPFVTAASTSADTVVALEVALRRVMADPELADARARLLLTGLAAADETVLGPILALRTGAALAGYPDLH